MLFDDQGKLLLKARVPIKPYFSSAPGLAEQHPEYFWEALCQACNQLWSSLEEQPKPQLSKDRIRAVSLTTQRSTLINLDKNHQPLRPAIVWLDQRRSEGLKPLGGIWGLLFRLAGASRTVAYLQAEAEANWIAINQPEIWQTTDKYVFLSGYLTFRLTNRLVNSVGCQVGYMPFDYKNLQWSKSWDWKWQVLPITPSMLIDLLPPASVLGEITAEAAEQTGIPKGLPLIAAALR